MGISPSSLAIIKLVSIESLLLLVRLRFSPLQINEHLTQNDIYLYSYFLVYEEYLCLSAFVTKVSRFVQLCRVPLGDVRPDAGQTKKSS